MLKISRSFLLVMSSLFLMLTAPFTFAASGDNTSFADFKYVIQVSDLAPEKITLALNNASNILKYNPPGSADVEIVTYNIGLRLLFKESAFKKRVDSLAQSGVRFSACGVTLAGMTKQLGYEPELNPVAKRVKGGIGRIRELVKDGYVYIKP